MTTERFKHDPQNFVGCCGPTLVYVGVRDRKTFDEIGLPCHDSGENDNGHVLTKTKGDMMPGDVTVIFQYWVKSRTIEAWREDCERERAEKSLLGKVYPLPASAEQ
jgi:hypothetical protein